MTAASGHSRKMFGSVWCPKANIGRRLNRLLMHAAEIDHRQYRVASSRRCAAGYFLVLGSSAGLT
jgi:hypothetical protein